MSFYVYLLLLMIIQAKPTSSCYVFVLNLALFTVVVIGG